MKKFCLRHWRGKGQIIPDIMKDSYRDYPKNSMNRNAGSCSLSECIVQVLTEDEYLKYVLDRYGVDEHNKMVKKHQLGSWKLIQKEVEDGIK